MRRCNLMKIVSILITVLMLASLPMNVLAEDSKNNNTYYLGKPVLTDNGYSGDDEIDSHDPHYGWLLGNFFLTGYTSKSEEDGSPIFLKTVGDTVSLWFNLEQDIDALNGDDDLVISDDTNGFDEGFQIKKTNFGKGALIVRKTDYQNKVEEPQLYTDYLSGVKLGADTKIDVYEEGDYEVALDYEIRNKEINTFGFTLYSSYTHYSIRFKFSVRNGNCMVFPFDTETKEELTNKAITENGFYLDLAKSRYLDINIKKEVLKEGADGLTEDVRFNKPAKDGEQYTDEGIYTITVKNKYTNEETVKKIYVGTNSVLKAYMTTGYSIRDIEDLIAAGATVDDNGYITIPKTEEKPDVVETMSNSAVVINEANEQNVESNEKAAVGISQFKSIDRDKIVAIAVLALVSFIIIFVVIRKHKIYKKKKNKNEDETKG